MGLAGIWRNSYGSIMDLRQGEDGRLHGSYSSTTGSTGTYPVLGWADPRERGAELGQSLALAVSWRSLGDDPADPSWHWVSGHGGQLLGQGGQARLLLMHDLVATAAFPGQAGIGRHLDKLVFVPAPEARAAAVAPAGQILAAARGEACPGPLGRPWGDPGDPSLRLDRLTLLDPRLGFAEASLRVGGRSCRVLGFVDPCAGAEPGGLQAISLAGLLDPDRGETISLSGWLDPLKPELVLTVFRNLGTAPACDYTMTTVDQFRLIPAP